VCVVRLVWAGVSCENSDAIPAGPRAGLDVAATTDNGGPIVLSHVPPTSHPSTVHLLVGRLFSCHDIARQQITSSGLSAHPVRPGINFKQSTQHLFLAVKSLVLWRFPNDHILTITSYWAAGHHKTPSQSTQSPPTTFGSRCTSRRKQCSTPAGQPFACCGRNRRPEDTRATQPPLPSPHKPQGFAKPRALPCPTHLPKQPCSPAKTRQPSPFRIPSRTSPSISFHHLSIWQATSDAVSLPREVC